MKNNYCKSKHENVWTEPYCISLKQPLAELLWTSVNYLHSIGCKHIACQPMSMANFRSFICIVVWCWAINELSIHCSSSLYLIWFINNIIWIGFSVMTITFTVHYIFSSDRFCTIMTVFICPLICLPSVCIYAFSQNIHFYRFNDIVLKLCNTFLA